MSAAPTYKVDVYFQCEDPNRLYMLLDCLKEVAIRLDAKNPYPTYLGTGSFQVVWSKIGQAEIQDTCQGVARLWTTKLNKSTYEIVRSIFKSFWDENYDIVTQEKVRDSRKITKLSDFLTLGL